MSYQQSVNKRREFAREQYAKILSSFTVTKSGHFIDVIGGYKSRKLNQAFQIYSHYMKVSGYSINPTAFFYN